MPDTTRILVTGDYGVDVDIYLQSRDPNPQPGADPTSISAHIGGAALVYELLAHVAKQAKDAPIPDGNLLDVGFRRNAAAGHAFAPSVAALWEATPSGRLIADSKAEVWRVTGSGVSLGAGAQIALPADVAPPPDVDAAFRPDVLVLEDDNALFRFKLPPVQWPGALDEGATDLPQWIVLKMGSPVCHGDLWWTLSSSPKLMDRLVVIVPVEHLRRENVRISRGISWERTALDLRHEVAQSPALTGLTAARHTIVTFHGEGALWIERKPDGSLDWHLFFDARLMEDESAARMGITGGAYGFMACVTAAVTAHLAGVAGRAGEGDRIACGIRHGLLAARLLRAVGHGIKTRGRGAGMTLPAIAELILAADPARLKGGVPQLDYRQLGSFGHVMVPPMAVADEAAGARWRILEHADCGGRPVAAAPCGGREPLYGAARRLTLNGLKALTNVPYAEFGKLVTADRDEIEALRNIKRLMQDYDGQHADLKPLSIAVFGPPGAGKSFGIKQIAGEACDERKLAFLEFNLSQFDDMGDLIGAFHQVRDRVLNGKLPVVFWDEFDSGNYKWLQFLLAPMQDGKFQEGQLTHPIGKCIFVFAGATSYDRENFGPGEVSEELAGKIDLSDRQRRDIEKIEDARADFKLKKGPDFLSRLHGYLNVLGPNQRQTLDRTKTVPEWVDDDSDICFPVRRALLLRALLGFMGKNANARIEMDPGLMAALLEVGHYKHGARSLEKIAQSLQTGKGVFHRSDLPSDEVLRMHVKEFGQFAGVLGRARIFQDYAKRLAPAIHERWRADKRQKMGTQAFRNDVGFDALPAEVKASNVAAAMRIPQILELAGMYLVPREEADRDTDAGAEARLTAMQDALAEEEHILWVAFMRATGWRQAKEGETRDDLRRIHVSIDDYHKLPKDVQDYDTGQVINYPALANDAGFVILATRPRTDATA